MQDATPSMIDLKSFPLSQVENLFALAKRLKIAQNFSSSPTITSDTIALMFFEPSTRTRLSFQTAVHRAGYGALIFEGGGKTSLEKGETVEDSVLNVAAMHPKLVIIRCGDEVDLPALARKISMPVINAGWGVKGHPTQALLDLFTLHEKWGGLRGKKLVIVGDVKHSRVASSHRELAKICGLELAFCGPKEFLSAADESASVKNFSRLGEALEWCDAVMALRVQFERHASSVAISKEDYHAQFGLTAAAVQKLKASGWILHPGPINHGLEMDTDVLQDPRSLVLEQVSSGVVIREALIRQMGGKA
jgi:aspartate carbamoyltransferase catalytic subunit